MMCVYINNIYTIASTDFNPIGFKVVHPTQKTRDTSTIGYNKLLHYRIL